MTNLQVFEKAPTWFKDQLFMLSRLRERPDFHPESSCWEHVLIVSKRAAMTGNINLVLTGWLHDSFKLKLNQINPKTGYPTAPGHDIAAATLIRNNEEIQQWIKSCGGDVECVAWLCEQHMRIGQLSQMRPFKQEKFTSHEWFPLLEVFHRCDDMTTEFKF